MGLFLTVLFKNKTGSRWQANASARTRTSQLHWDRHLLPSPTVSTRAVPIANRPHKHVPPSQPSPQMSALIPYCPCKHLSSPLPRYYRCPNYRDHITPVLRQLHWLLVRQRVVFKIAGLVRQSLGGLAPAYLADDCRLLSDVGRRPLLSNSDDMRKLLMPRTHNKLGDRSFTAAGPRQWNDLPPGLRRPGTYLRLLQKISENSFIWRPKRLM